MIQWKAGVLVLGLFAALPAYAQERAALYRPTVLAVDYTDYTYPGKLNNRGDYSMGAKSDSPNPWRQQLHYAAGGSEYMGEFWKLNDHGQAIGVDWELIPETIPYEYRYFGSYLNGSTVSELPGYPTGLNNAGVVVARTPSGTILFDIGTGQTTALPTLDDKPTFGSDINDGGQVVGIAMAADGSEQAFIYENGTMSALPFGGESIRALDINSSGQIFSIYTDGDGVTHRVLYSNGVITDLTDIVRANSLIGFNDLGQILFSHDGVYMMYIDGEAYPVKMVDFNPANPEFYMVSSLNDKGQLLAMTCPHQYSSQVCDVVRLDFVSTIPEPPVWAMMVVGLALAARPWRRRK